MNLVQQHLRNFAAAACAAIAVPALASAPALAWEPTEEVEMVIHAGPTSSTNFYVREVQRHFDKLLPHGADAVHMTGAGGDRARRYIIGKKGDPHVMMGLTPSQVNNPILHGADYSVDDFTPLAVMVISPMMLCVKADSDYKTLDDLIEAARKNPGKIVQGGGDVGETDSLHHVLLSEKAGVKMTFTPFESKGIVELLGDHIDFIMVNPAQANPYVESGDFRVLALSLSMEAYPDVPTFEEAGYDIQILTQYRGLWMPSDVPTEARDYYIAKLKEVSESSGFQAYVKKNNLVAEFIAGDDLAEMLKAEEVAYRKLDTDLGLIKE